MFHQIIRLKMLPIIVYLLHNNNLMVLNTFPLYFDQNSFHYFKYYLMTKLDPRVRRYQYRSWFAHKSPSFLDPPGVIFTGRNFAKKCKNEKLKNWKKWFWRFSVASQMWEKNWVKNQQICSSWFPLCSQKYRRMIKFWTLLLVNIQIWLNFCRDDCHIFFYIFPWMTIG
jgi:hypothetical protein